MIVKPQCDAHEMVARLLMAARDPDLDGVVAAGSGAPVEEGSLQSGVGSAAAAAPAVGVQQQQQQARAFSTLAAGWAGRVGGAPRVLPLAGRPLGGGALLQRALRVLIRR